MENKKNIKPIDRQNIISYSIICRLNMSLCSYLMCSCVLFLIFFIVGNFQNFTDNSQLLLLSVLSVLSIMLTVSSFFGIVVNSVFLFLKVRIHHRIICIIVFILMIIIAVVLLLFSSILKQLSTGI